MTTIATLHERVLERIRAACQRAGRPEDSVLLVAVSKYRPLEQTMQLYRAGQRHLGESRVQEAREKIPEMPPDIVWHLIGRLQTNKAKYLPGLVEWVHSVDRLSVAEALEKAYAKEGKSIRVLLQINAGGEEQKAGVEPEEAEEFVRQCAALPHLDVQGLMTMAPFVEDPEQTRPVFRRMRELAEELRASTGLALPHLSMGMTNDFEVAVEEGATMVRVGTALYEST